jgi:hypothetical protein
VAAAEQLMLVLMQAQIMRLLMPTLGCILFMAELKLAVILAQDGLFFSN